MASVEQVQERGIGPTRGRRSMRGHDVAGKRITNYTYMMMKQDMHATLETTRIQESLEVPGKQHCCCTAAVVATWACLFKSLLAPMFQRFECPVVIDRGWMVVY